jgi:hypothetical protein
MTRVVNVPPIDQQAIDAAVDDALSSLLPADLGDKPHLARALVAERLSAVAKHRSRTEVAAARDDDGASWDDVAHAFGISAHDAQEHFRTTQMGLPE